jgi:hypothetical protein
VLEKLLRKQARFTKADMEDGYHKFNHQLKSVENVLAGLGAHFLMQHDTVTNHNYHLEQRKDNGCVKCAQHTSLLLRARGEYATYVAQLNSQASHLNKLMAAITECNPTAVAEALEANLILKTRMIEVDTENERLMGKMLKHQDVDQQLSDQLKEGLAMAQKIELLDAKLTEHELNPTSQDRKNSEYHAAMIEAIDAKNVVIASLNKACGDVNVANAEINMLTKRAQEQLVIISTHAGVAAELADLKIDHQRLADANAQITAELADFKRMQHEGLSAGPSPQRPPAYTPSGGDGGTLRRRSGG